MSKGKQQAKIVAGVDFIDDSTTPAQAPVQSNVVPIQRTAESDKANQESAKRALAKARVEQLKEREVPEVETLTAEEEKQLAPKLYRALKDRVINRGAAQYTVKCGKILSANQFNIPDLRRQGVEMEEIVEE